jgi:hypothetical protein
MVGLCVLRKFSVGRSPAAPALSTLPAGEMNGKRIWPERGECYTVRQFNELKGTKAEGAELSGTGD